MGMPQTVSGKDGGVEMKRGWKIFWGICGVLTGIGIVCCVIAMALGFTTDMIADRFPDGIGIIRYNSDYGSESYSRDVDVSDKFDGIHSIDAQVSMCSLQVLESEDEHVRIETAGISSRLRLKYYVEDGELKIRTRKKWSSMAGVNHAGTIYIYIPAQHTLRETNFEMGAGEMYIQNIKAESLDIQVGAGEAVIDSFQAEEADMECGAGSIMAAGEAGRELNIDCGIGEIDMTARGRKEDYSYELKCGIGNIDLGDESFSGLGRKKEIYNSTGREMNIDCGIGDVTVQFEE